MERMNERDMDGMAGSEGLPFVVLGNMVYFLIKALY